MDISNKICAHSSVVEQSPLKRLVEGPNPSGRTLKNTFSTKKDD